MANRFAWLAATSIAVMLIIAIALARGATTAPPDIEWSYTLGSKLPSGISCNVEYVSPFEDYYHCYVGTTVISLSWRTGLIAHISIPYQARLGDLIALWGYPAGVSRYKSMSFVYWPGYYALVYGDEFTPFTLTARLGHGPQSWLGTQRWEGFKSLERGKH